MRKLSRYFFILIILFSNKAFAQNELGKLTGKITDKVTNAPLEAVTVQLLIASDNSLISGTETNTDGIYTFENVKQDRYNVKITMIGYSEALIKNVSVSSSLSLETVMLTAGTTTTEEIVVESEKSDVQFAPDKKIFNVEKNHNYKGGTAIDILRNLPSVIIDADNNISLRGSEGVKIMVDGKPFGLEGSNRSQVLQQLSADQISSVEVITNPGAKYDAEGTSGIINILLKKKDGFGYNGNIILNAGTKDKYTGSSSFNLKKDNVNVFANYDYNLQNFVVGGFADRQFYSGSISDVHQVNDGKVRYRSHLVKGGVDITIDPMNSLSLSMNYSNRNRTRNENVFNNEYDFNGNLLSEYYTFTNETGTGNNFDINLLFTRKFKNPKQTFTTDITFSNARDNGNSNIFTDITIPVKTNQINDDLTRNIRGQMDYVHPFSESSKIETGVKFTLRKNDKDFMQEDYDNQSGSYIFNNELSNRFKYDEYISAAYMTYTGTVLGLNYIAGLRSEYTKTKGSLVTTGTEFSTNYLDFFPNASVSYKISPTNEIQASYSRRINRPYLQWLNPFRIYSDANNSMAGNPNLKPEYIDSYEMSYIQYIGKSTSITPTLFFRNVKDKMARTIVFTDSNSTMMTFVNYNSTKTLGGEVMFNSQILPWWGVNGSFSIYSLQDDASNVKDDFERDYRTTWTGRASSSIKLPDIVNLQLNYFYSGKYYFAQGYVEPHQSFDISMNRDIIPNRLNVGLRLSDVFNTMKFKVRLDEANYSQDFQRKRDTRVVYFSFNYKFGQSDQQQPQRRPRKDNNEPQDGFGF